MADVYELEGMDGIRMTWVSVTPTVSSFEPAARLTVSGLLIGKSQQAQHPRTGVPIYRVRIVKSSYSFYMDRWSPVSWADVAMINSCVAEHLAKLEDRGSQMPRAVRRILHPDKANSGHVCLPLRACQVNRAARTPRRSVQVRWSPRRAQPPPSPGKTRVLSPVLISLVIPA